MNEKYSKCSSKINKKMTCLFSFKNEKNEIIYLKAEHYAADLNPIEYGSEKTEALDLSSEKNPLTSVIKFETESEKIPLKSVIEITKELTGSEKTPLKSVIEITKELTGSEKTSLASTPTPISNTISTSEPDKESRKKMLKSLDFNEYIKKKREEDKKKPITATFKKVRNFLNDKELHKKLIEAMKK